MRSSCGQGRSSEARVWAHGRAVPPGRTELSPRQASIPTRVRSDRCLVRGTTWFDQSLTHDGRSAESDAMSPHSRPGHFRGFLKAGLRPNRILGIRHTRDARSRSAELADCGRDSPHCKGRETRLIVRTDFWLFLCRDQRGVAN